MNSKEKAIDIISKSKLYSGVTRAEESLIILIAEALDKAREDTLEEAALEVEKIDLPFHVPQPGVYRIAQDLFGPRIRTLKSKGETNARQI